jgi:hypothetical protein
LDWVNEIFGYSLAHHFYDTFLVLNLPPKLVRFGDQNKTRYAGGRWEIQPILEKEFHKKLQHYIPRSDFYEAVKKKIDERNLKQDLNAIKNKKRAAAKKISDKYFPPSTSKGTLFIVEGSCIQENTKINIWRNGEPMQVEMKDLIIGDEVVTHANRIQKILMVQKKLKQTKRITLENGESLIQSSAHRYYVYDKTVKSFMFLSVDEIIPKRHALIKNRLNDFIGTISVIERYKKDGEYSECFILENGEFFENTPNHSYSVFDPDTQSFFMKLSKDIQKNDLIAAFSQNL